MDQGDLSIFLSSDLPHPVRLQLHIRPVHLLVDSCNSVNISVGIVTDVEVPARTAGHLSFTSSLTDLFARDDPRMPQCSLYSCYVDIQAHYSDPELMESSSNVHRSLFPRLNERAAAETQIFLMPFKDLELQTSEVELHSFHRRSEDEICFKASTSVSASLFIVFEHREPLEGAFSDNLFHVEPCGQRSICFVGHDKEGELTEEALKSRLRIQSITNVLQ